MSNNPGHHTLNLGVPIRNFFLPRLTKWFFIRLSAVALLAFLICKFVLLPCVISGGSMEPTVSSHGFTFCWRGRYLFGTPQRGDVVIIKYDDRIYFLKRVVGLPGETVEFRDGELYIDGVAQREPYVIYRADWQMDPVKVEPGEYFVVGDNRGMPYAQHQKGRVRAARIIGAPLW